MSDYKYEAQLLAEEAAEQEYGKDLSELPEEVQCLLYTKALEKWYDKQCARAEMLRDMQRDKDMGL